MVKGMAMCGLCMAFPSKFDIDDRSPIIMSIHFRILGGPGRDNALLVQVDSGQAVERLLFDCGEGCVSELSFGEIQDIDHVFFSHFHMDHIAGFDSFFRCVFNRETKPNYIWGPPGTRKVMHHRFRGFLWNLHEQMAGSWRVSDLYPEEGRISTGRYELRESFASAHEVSEARLPQGVGYTVEAFTMNHRTPSMAYLVREKARWNIDASRLGSLGLRPGPWLKQLKDSVDDESTLDIEGVTYSVADLRKSLLTETPGDSIAYLTDFLMDETAMKHLEPALLGCRVIVCESQYRHCDEELAQKNYHMTSVQAATLAQRAGAEMLVLFHLSDRYRPDEWLEMIQEAREVFSNTRVASEWGLIPNI